MNKEFKHFVVCPICMKQFSFISFSHLRKHNLKLQEFKELYPNTQLVSDRKRLNTSKSCKSKGCGKWLKGVKLTQEHKDKISIVTSGNKNPFYGKKHSTEAKLTMKQNHADFKADKNPLSKWLKSCSKEEYEEYCKICKKKKEDLKNDSVRYKKFIEKLSKSITQAQIDGKCKSYGRGHKHGHFYSKKQNLKIYYRSSWELKFLEWCEQSDAIKSFEGCHFAIPYFESAQKNYLPDFLLNEKIVIEIKPEKFIKNNSKKIDAANIYCHNNNLTYVILSEKELANLDGYFKEEHYGIKLT